jgi:hypothetical protein
MADTRDRRAYYREWYLTHRDEHCSKVRLHAQEHPRIRPTAYHVERRQSLREFIDELKHGKVCARCGNADPRVLDFHHVEPGHKRWQISVLAKNEVGRQAILAELAKCEPLCANCHRILHWEEREHRVAPQPQAL